MNLIQRLLDVDLSKIHRLSDHFIIFMDLFPNFSLLCIHFSYYTNWNASLLTFMIIVFIILDKTITDKSHWRLWKSSLTESHSSVFLDHPKTKKSIHSWENLIMLQKNLINLMCKHIYTWSTLTNQYLLVKFCEYLYAFKSQKKTNIRQEFLSPRQKIMKVTTHVHFHHPCATVFLYDTCKNSWPS